MSALDDHTPDDILCDAHVVDFDFHPSQDVLALASITGVVEM
jgi:hypothetical protein